MTLNIFPYGSLPHTNINSISNIFDKIYPQAPYNVLLPNISESDTLLNLTLGCFDGITFDGKNYQINEDFFQRNDNLGYIIKNRDEISLDKFDNNTVYTKKFLEYISKKNPKYAIINLLGPYTLSQIFSKYFKTQILLDNDLKKVILQIIAISSINFVKRIKNASEKTVPVIVLEEDLLSQFAYIKRKYEDITPDFVTNYISKIVNILQSKGAKVAIKSYEKCDWRIILGAKPDIISFDAYTNPANLNILPVEIQNFLAEGGIINWAIVPCKDEETVKNIVNEQIIKRLLLSVDDLEKLDVNRNLLYKNLSISLQSHMDKIPLVFAERAMFSLVLLGKDLKAKLH